MAHKNDEISILCLLCSLLDCTSAKKLPVFGEESEEKREIWN